MCLQFFPILNVINIQYSQYTMRIVKLHTGRHTRRHAGTHAGMKAHAHTDTGTQMQYLHWCLSAPVSGFLRSSVLLPEELPLPPLSYPHLPCRSPPLCSWSATHSQHFSVVQYLCFPCFVDTGYGFLTVAQSFRVRQLLLRAVDKISPYLGL